MSRRLNRREFLRNVSATGSAAWLVGRGATSFGAASPNEKLNIAVIGTAGRAEGNIQGVESQNIVAVCDIDDNLLDQRRLERFPEVPRNTPISATCLSKPEDIDAVVVSTADHVHAPATAMALRLGKHVYCEKPLSHSVYEARTVVAEACREGEGGDPDGHADPCRGQLPPGRRTGSNPARSARSASVTSGSTANRGPAANDRRRSSAGAERVALGPLDRPRARCVPIQPDVPARQLATLVGFRQRDPGRHGLSLHGPAVLGVEIEESHVTVQSEGPPVHPETTPSPGCVVNYEFPARDDHARR